MNKTIALIGAPGSGKSRMACLTAVNQPVHVLDIDRKIGTMEILKPAVAAGKVTYWELQDTLAEDPLASRMLFISENKKPLKKPLGWEHFANQVDRLKSDPAAQAAGTWFVDSYTRVCEHMKRIILHYDQAGISSLSPRNWGAYLAMNEESLTVLIDTAKHHKKDLIISVHEQVREVPNVTTKVRHEKNKQGIMERLFEGSMDMKIHPTVEGQFSGKMFSYFEEVYGLRVEMVSGKPKWICRVKPDGLRDLRTSFDVKAEEFEPDFRVIWGGA